MRSAHHKVLRGGNMVLTRRSVVKAAAIGAALSAIGPMESLALPPDAADDRQFRGLRVGVASYSLRNFPADQALQDIQRLGVHYVSLKDVHLKIADPPEKRQELRKQA